jgi:hypothetical protein
MNLQQPSYVTFFSFFLVAYLGCYFAISPIFNDPDVLWHLMAGLHILDHGAIPASDPWSFTAQGTSWHLVSWAWDLMLGLVYRLGGVAALYVLVSAVSALVVTLLLYNLIVVWRGEQNVVANVLLLAYLVLLCFASARSQMAGFICVLLFQLLLAQRLRLYWLPLIMIIWVNTHGSFVVGLVVLGAYGLEALFQKNYVRFRELFIAGLACLLALCVNPYGIFFYKVLQNVFGSDMYLYISEWKPFKFDVQYPVTIWLVMLFTLAITVGVRATIADTTLTLLWLVAMLMSQRNAMYFILFSAPVMMSGLQNLKERFAHLCVAQPPAYSSTTSVPVLFFALLSVMAASYLAPNYIWQDKGYVIEAEKNSEAAIGEYQKYCQQRKFLTDYNLGGYIIYLSGGHCPVFVDGREATAYPADVLKDYIAYIDQAPDWQERILRRGITGIFMANDSVFVKAHEAGQYQEWRQVYKDKVASIYLLNP